MVTIGDIVAQAQTIGIFQYYLPFLIMFTIIYGLLMKTKIFGEPAQAKAINLIIAVSLAAFILIYPGTSGVVVNLTAFLTGLVGGTLIIIVTILMFMLMLYVILGGLAGVGDSKKPNAWVGLVMIPVAIIIIALFIVSGGFGTFPGLATISLSTPTLPYLGLQAIGAAELAIIIIVILTIAAMFWLTRDNGAPARSGHS